MPYHGRDQNRFGEEMMGREPFLCFVKCEECGREWTAFFPDGMDKTKGIECPNCGEMEGRPNDQV